MQFPDMSTLFRRPPSDVNEASANAIMGIHHCGRRIEVALPEGEEKRQSVPSVHTLDDLLMHILT